MSTMSIIPTSAEATIAGTSAVSRFFARSIFRKTLFDNRRVMSVWAVGTGLLTLMYASFYPQMTETAVDIPEAMQGFGFDDMTSAAGYLQGAVFGILLPLLVVFYGAATGARLIAADEESGYLDLILAHPVKRLRFLLQRFAALTAGAAIIGSVALLALLAVRSSADLENVSVGGFAAQAVNLTLLGVLFGALSMGLGAALGGSRGTVFGTTAGLGVIAYALHGFVPQIGIDWLRYLTPFHYYIGNEPLRNGFNLTDAATLIGGVSVLIGVGIWGFARRDLAR
jgi:ABC-2 type transport system permease protein